MNFDNHLFRASSLGTLYTNPRSKSEDLSETTKKELLKIWVEATTGRTKEINSKYLTKGSEVEEKSITLFSEVTGLKVFKCRKEFKNDYFVGHPDLIYQLDDRKVIVDFKSSWDVFTFYEAKNENPKKDYVYQLNCYRELVDPNAEMLLVHCLIDTPLHLIEQEAWKFRRNSPEVISDDEFQNKILPEFEAKMTYSDIPKEKRVSIKKVDSVDLDKESVKKWREYLNQLQ